MITGARAVTGWSLADSGQEHLAGQRRRRDRHPAALRQRRHRHPGAHRREPRPTSPPPRTGLRFTNSALSYLNNLGQPEPGRAGERRLVHRPVRRRCRASAATSSRCSSPAWNNNTFGYDTLTSPHRAGPLYLANAYEFLDSPGEWYLNPGTGALYYIPLAGQNMSTVSVELPQLQSLVNVGGTYDAPAHHISFSGHHVHRHQLARPQQQPGLRRPADRRVHHRQLDRRPTRSTSCQSGCPQFEATRPNWNQMPAAVQVSAANTITFSDSQFVNLGPDGHRHRQRRQRPRQRCRPGRQQHHRHPVRDRPQLGRRHRGRRRARRRAPPQRPADGQPRHHRQQQPHPRPRRWSTAASSRS